jgi:hypothetical protein
MANKNAKVIIPLAVGIWLLSIIFLQTGMPQAVQTGFLVVLVLGMVVGQMAMVSVNHPQYQRNTLRLASTLRVGTAADALYLSTLFSRLPVLGLFFPTVRIAWPAISKATPYEAPGWVGANQGTGALLQATYDPNYTGTFVELEVGDPPVFLQLPADVLGDELSRLPSASAPNQSTGYAS